MSPVDFSDHVPVCNDLLKEAQSRVWPLQHFCRLAIRKYMGVGRRRRIKELPLPRHVISYLISLPISCSDRLHANWERTRSTKCKLVKERLESHRPKRGGATNVGVLQVLKGSSDL
ncbi:PREDICTED: uncharacterized protein LOC109584376 [Amphimedon queenslandica]|uniref:SOCS box domain-containing protein n=1 Tax=Amphimedon queenslandica TaxID=400682 RepID=A0AAN0JF43_AMPQE|nr:PREDICTED: uncharacterized protein LOC109584376 [Amphimedon queenslandica]|eukprot:XP_019855655.1 PREDICTED: uncharacterized protein LOC109584376 [Amphimedon queenslandica]